MDSHRLERVSRLLQEQLGLMINQGEIKDPRVSTLLSVSHVSVSKDLAYAKVFISTFESAAKLDQGVLGLTHAAGFIQGIIGKRIRLRTTPRLTFIADHGIETGFRINEKIKEALS